MRASICATALAIGALIAACSDGKTPQRGPEAPTSGGSGAAGKPAAGEPGASSAGAGDGAPAVRLADSPRIDLLDNRYRWHLYRDGLFIPMAAEGFRKYTQEYSRPFGPLAKLDGRVGRVLERRAAFLNVPWDGAGAATLRLWVHGAAPGQRIQINVNGSRAGVVSAPAAWNELTVPIEAGLLHAGENELRIFAARAGRAGGERTWGLYYALELLPGTAEASGAWPALRAVSTAAFGGEKRESLSGFSRMVIYVEVPKSAWLRLDTGAAESSVHFKVSARTFDGDPQTLLDQAAKPGAWQRHTLSLEPFVDRLIALQLEVEGGAGAWGEPRIALKKAPVEERPAPFKNLVLVVVDALRADRLSLYAKTPVSTPRMTSEAKKRGVVFSRNQSASCSSPPSHGSIQTGMIPRVHGVAGDKGRLEPGTPTISTQLDDAGVATGYYGNNPFGMARLEKPGRWTAFHQPNQEGHGIDCTELIREMVDFARAQHEAGKRFFISSLPYEPHTPYRYHEGVSDKFYKGDWGPPIGKSVDGYLTSDIVSGKLVLTDDQWKQLHALYNGEVEHMDLCFGQLVDGLSEIGVGDDTAIILTSDHGEGMFEHGHMGHAYGNFAELANVPFVLYAGGLVKDGPRTIETVTTSRDIAPTVLDLMGVKPSDKIQGRSLLPLVLRQGPWTPRVVSIEYGRSYALRARRFKLLVGYNGEESLFDLEKDPFEQKDIQKQNPFAMRYLHDLAGFFLEHRKAWRMSTFGSLGNQRAGFVKHVAEIEAGSAD